MNLTAMVIGAIGVIVTVGILFWGQALERRSRRKELLLSKAVDRFLKEIASGYSTLSPEEQKKRLGDGDALIASRLGSQVAQR